MPEIIQKVTNLVTSTTTTLSTLFVAVAVCALIALCITLAVTHNDAKRSGYIKSIGTVLVIAVVAAGSSSLVSWAMA